MGGAHCSSSAAMSGDPNTTVAQQFTRRQLVIAGLAAAVGLASVSIWRWTSRTQSLVGVSSAQAQRDATPQKRSGSRIRERPNSAQRRRPRAQCDDRDSNEPTPNASEQRPSQSAAPPRPPLRIVVCGESIINDTKESLCLIRTQSRTLCMDTGP